MKPKIFVTGSEGYVGKILCPSLFAYGYEIIRYDKAFDQDIRDVRRLESEIQECDYVIHLAGFPRPELGNVDYLGTNYYGSLNVFHAAVKAGLKKMIFASSGCVYGAWKGNIRPDQLPITEENYKPILNVDNQTYYGHLKIQTEEYLRENANEFGLQCVSLRLELPGVKTAEANHHNLYAQTSIENVCQMFHLALSVDLDSYFEEFNVNDDYIPVSFIKFDKMQRLNIQKEIDKNWNGIPNYTQDNECLWSTKKAKRLLGYKPIRNGSYDH